MRICLAPAAAILSVLLLSACAAPAPKPQMQAEQRALQLEALNDYRVRGGLGIWTDEQSIPTRIDWLEQTGELTVKISGPLGIGNVMLVSKPGEATLTRGTTIIASGPSVDLVLQNGLGLSAPVPMQELQRWVRGLPGNAKSVVTDAQGKLSSLQYTDGQGVRWKARFLKYTELDGLALPALITASGGPYSVRLRLKDWQRITASVVPEQTQSDIRLVIPQR